EHMRIRPAPRTTRVRKAVPSGEDPRLNGLTNDELWIYTLAEEDRPLYAIAYARLVPEAVAGETMTKLLERGLVLLVDERLERDLEQDLAGVMAQSRAQLEQVPRTSPGQLMLALTQVMGDCANSLLAHHARFA